MPTMKEITFDDLFEQIKTIEDNTAESEDTLRMLKDTAMQVENMAFYNDKITILTDYDADGICSAYIMEKLINTLAPDCDVTVTCNDRRNAYGLSPDIKRDEDTKYIVCDMGSNQLAFARQELGEDVIIIDHHLIEDDAVAKEFQSSEGLNQNLCNPHCFSKDDSENAQYCATGLAYRIYQLAEERCKEQGKDDIFTEKQDNTVAIVACIGTATDMVNVLDMNSYNREILKDGVKRIDEATPENTDLIIGRVLEVNDIQDRVTAHQLAFNVGAYLNAPSRMSETLNQNGAMKIYNVLSGKQHDNPTAEPLTESQRLKMVEAFVEVNKSRKAAIAELTSSPEYKQFVEDQYFGKDADKNIAVYVLPDDTPHALAGLVAGKLTDATDKAIICVTKDTETGNYSGSGRNTSSNETSLKAFMDYAVTASDRKEGFEIKYGGHEDAIGVSALNDIDELKRLIDKASDAMQQKPLEERSVLKFDITTATKKDLDSLYLAINEKLEPTGIGNQLPLLMVKGEETHRDDPKKIKANNPNWKTITVGKASITDWAYNEQAYPQSGAKGTEISFLAEMSISSYKGQHIEAQAHHDRAVLAANKEEIEQSKNLSSKQVGR